MSYIYLNNFLGVTNTFKSLFKDGYSYSSTFLVIKKYFYFITVGDAPLVILS